MGKKIYLTLVLVLMIFLVGCSSQVQEAPTEDDNIDAQLKALEQQLNGVEEETASDEITGNVVEEDTTEELIAEETEELEIKTETEEQEINLETQQSEEKYFKTITVQETEVINLSIKASDKDKDSLTYTFSEPLDKDGVWKTNYADAGEYEVTISVSDGVKTTEKLLLVVVEKKNVAPEINDIPADMTVKETDLIKLSPKVLDKNKDFVELSFSLPFNENGEWQTDYESAGEYDVTITADDGEEKTTETTKIIVKNVNRLPEITGIEKEIFIKEGEVLELNPVVTDADGDSVDVIISEPVGNDGKWEIGYTEHGDYIVTIKANDGKESVEEKITVIVEDVNMAPEILDIVLG